jgi:hypothetical protein
MNDRCFSSFVGWLLVGFLSSGFGQTIPAPEIVVSVPLAGEHQSAAVTTDGGYVYARALFNPESDSLDYWFIQFDSNGKKVGEHFFGGREDETLYGVIGCPDGGFLLAGLTGRGAEVAGNFIYHNGDVVSDYWLVKVDARGNPEWERTLGGPPGKHGPPRSSRPEMADISWPDPPIPRRGATRLLPIMERWTGGW